MLKIAAEFFLKMQWLENKLQTTQKNINYHKFSFPSLNFLKLQNKDLPRKLMCLLLNASNYHNT